MAAPAGGAEAIHKLKSTSPPFFLSPSPELSQAARLASQFLFSTLRPFAPKSPFDCLLTDGFDSEQIWQQIDLQSQSLIPTLRRHVKHYEKNPDEISELFGGIGAERAKASDGLKGGKDFINAAEDEDVNELSDDGDSDEDEVEEETHMNGIDDDEEESEEDEEDEKVQEENEEDEEEDGGGGPVEDKFFKIKELEKFMEDDEAREYGIKKRKNVGDGGPAFDESDEQEEAEDEDGDDEDEDGDDEDEEDELKVDDDEDDDDENKLEKARYDDFFGSNKSLGENINTLSTHEKELIKMQAKIEQMEKANLEPKTWTMQGEVTAAKRQKNSALEVDLDFEHNARPAPVITEEVNASIEELIRQRILEGRFDDVQKPSVLPSRAPRQIKELDENKSKKGLGEIYEEEYVQKTGLVSAALSSSDGLKKEASLLFKKLCLKLDALSHFHFAPKPIIEEMSIQSNVPALTMEEIAPLAVSDAAMLAPEEVFSGKGDIKEEAELTQEDRKRRRAKKKRKFKAVASKTMAKKDKVGSEEA